MSNAREGMTGRKKKMNNQRRNAGPDPPDAPASEPKAKPQKKRLGPLGAFLIKLVIVAGILWITFTYILGFHIQQGNGMYPHVKDGDLLVTFKLEEYRVDDVVVYRRPDTGEKAVGRIKAKGETEITITETGEFMVNGVIIETERFYPTMAVADGGIETPYQMSGYFVLNDYRPSGSDSRLFGELDEDALLGKVVYVFRRRGI